MAIDTTLTGSAPYYDDWTASKNEDKNYLKILFQPGRPVQARELTQIQSGIQDQIDKFGRNVFVEGTRVLDGEIDIDNKVRWIEIELNNDAVNAAVDTDRPLIGKTLYADSGSATPSSNPADVDVYASILDYELVSDSKYRFYLRYNSGNEGAADAPDFNNSTRTFEDIKIGEDVETYLNANNVVGDGTTVVSTGYAIKIHNNKGVFFTKGYFVVAEEQTKYIKTAAVDGSSNPIADATVEGSIGFTITESTVTAVGDSTLYDNAQGTSNFSAPGADRYVITLGLTLISDDFTSGTPNVVATTASNVVNVTSLFSTEAVEPVKTKYNVLGETLAERTFEESGNYALQPFELDLREHLDNGENRGRYTTGNGGNPAKFVVGLEPSVAYVNGKRVEVLTKQEIVVDKARETEIHSDLEIQARQGSYIEGDSIKYLPTLNTVTYELYSSDSPGNLIGTCAVRGIEYTGRVYRLYIKDLALESGKLLRDAVHLEDSGSDDFEFTASEELGGFTLNDVSEFDDLFVLPGLNTKTLIKEASSINLPKRATSPSTSVNSSQLVINLSGSQKFYLDSVNDYIVYDNSTGDTIVVDAVSLTQNSTRLTLTLDNFTSGNAKVTYSFREEGSLRSKTKQIVSSEVISTATYSVGDTAALANDDVIEIISLVDSNGTNVLNKFNLDNGQTTSSYNNAKLICTEAIETSTTLTVSYYHFSHGSGDYFSVDSYPIADSSDATNIQREETPFVGGLSLLDQLDFRGSSTSLDPNGIIEIDKKEDFLPRHDRIVLKSNGKFEYLVGDAAGNNPQKIPDDGMLLYDLDVPAFTASVADIEIGYHDNKRYTMRDIGKIEKRVKNLEYYTSLSLLERQTRDKTIADSSGDRFKNGILVDEFKGHSVGDPADPGYLAAVDPERGELRPSFAPTNIGIYNTDNTASDVTVSGSAQIGAEDMIRLPSSGVKELINQPHAAVAISVNPFDVASWVGEIRLSPSSDEWKDTNRRPDVIIKQDNNAEAILLATNAALAASGTRWNDWNTTWSGVTATTSLGWQSFGATQRHFGDRAQHTRNCNCGHRNTLTVPTFNGGTLTGRQGGNGLTRGQFLLEQRTTRTEQIREGIQQFAELQTITQSVGDRVVDTSFVPFIRSRKVYFEATGLKPNTRVYPFFDNIDLSDYSSEAAFVEFRDDQTRTDHTDDSPGEITSGNLVTDSNGDVSGYFVIPNNEGLRFRTGERQFRLVDRSDNDLSIANTYATATYTARGIVQTVQEQIISTQQVVIDERRVTETRTVTSTETAATAVRHVDPLAQTFVVDPDRFPDGVFVKDIDLFFRQVHSTLPVRIQLVTTENGIPTQKVVPFSRVRKTAAQMADRASEDASVATNFTFKSPIHLKAGVEYAVVVLSNSPDYLLWHSEVGGTDVLTGKRIIKNPYTGVALKSANASTWTPDQNKDFKFIIRYMEFDVGTKTVGGGAGQTGHGNFIPVLPAGVDDSPNQLFVDAVNLIADSVILPQTSAKFTINIGGSTYNIEPNRVIELPSRVEVTEAGDITVNCSLTTNNSLLTPMIDMGRMSLLTFKNGINDDNTSEDSPTHGAAEARYITRMTSLENASTRMDVYVDISRPSSITNVEAYIRYTDGGTFTKMQSNAIPIGGGFNEVHFRTSEDEPSYDKFQIKFVLLSSDGAQIPKLKNFRAIATS